MGRCAGSPNISTTTAARSIGSRRWACCTRAFARGAKSRPRSRAPAAPRKGRPDRSIPEPAAISAPQEVAARQRSGLDFALRLDVARALALTGPLDWVEEGEPAAGRSGLAWRCGAGAQGGAGELSSGGHRRRCDPGRNLGDPRRRSEEATHIHRLLQALLGLPTPRYRHHPLLTDATGRRLAKRDGAPTIRSMRENGMTPDEIIRLAEQCFPPAAFRHG